MKLQIINGKISAGVGTLSGYSIYCEDGQITEVSIGNRPRPGYEVVDAKDYIVGPGGIDMHVHGGGAHDFNEVNEEAYRAIIDAHLKHGCTSIYPTLNSSTREDMETAAEIVTRLMQEENTPVQGLHYEGPYLNENRTHRQWPGIIRLADPTEYIPLLDKYPCIKRWDAAPEMLGAKEFGRECAKRGVKVALAYTEAGFNEVMEGLENGFRHASNFYNAMTSVHNVREFKHEGTIESVYITDNITVECVGDGIHVPPVVLRLTHKLKGPERMAIVSDAVAPAGTNITGQFRNMYVEDGVAKVDDHTTLAGSMATMDRIMDTLVNKCHFSWGDAFEMTSTTPAQIMNIDDRKGMIAPGKDADICIYTHEAKLMYVIQAGRVIVANE